MFNLKRKLSGIGSLAKRITETTKDPNEVVAEIHEAFDTASEKLLNEAKTILSGSYDIEKGERLKKLGFIQAKKVIESQQVVSQKTESRRLATLIEYYQLNYPNNKFITEEKVKEICEKYGLLFADIKYYTSDVPEKNLSEIESFKLRQEETRRIDYSWMRWNRNNLHWGFFQSCTKEDEGAKYGFINSRKEFVLKPESETHLFEKDDFMICASVKDFDTRNMRIEDGYKLSQNIPDPIVLQPVNGGYLVVSKWGLEGDDSDLVNEKMN